MDKFSWYIEDRFIREFSLWWPCGYVQPDSFYGQRNVRTLLVCHTTTIHDYDDQPIGGIRCTFPTSFAYILVIRSHA